MHSEKDWIEACIAGERKAQRELYDRFASKMMGVCYRYASSRADAQDILQDSFIKVFHYLPTYRFDGSLEGWIRRIVVNTAINFVKQQKKFTLEEDLEPLAEVLPGDSFMRETENDLDTEQLMQCVRQLPDGYRVILNMFAIEGYSHKEIASQLGINESTSRSQYARAKTHLLKQLEKIKTKESAGSHVGRTV